MTARRSYRDETRARFLEFWERKEEYGAPVGCVATTFTFDETFFELDCLGRFAGIETDPQESQVGYVVEREEKLGGITACVLVDRSHAAERRSLRWRQLPAGPVTGGILHAKVSLLVWKDRVRVLVGSPNLTKFGYRKNLESLGCFDFTPEGDTPRTLLEDVLVFLENLVAAEGAGVAGSSRERVLSFLGSVRRQVKPWADRSWRPGEPSVHFVPIVPGGTSLFDQAASLWRGTGADRARIVSPFWDDAEQALEVVEQLVAIMGKNGERVLEFQAVGDLHNDGSLDLLLPEVYRRPGGPRRTHCFFFTPGKDEDGESRALHAKLLELTRGDETLLVVGSSNFTMAGTGCGKGPRRRNVEANVAYVIPTGHLEFARKCEEGFPPANEIDVAVGKVRFTRTTEVDDEEKPGGIRLPGRFGEALFAPEGEGGHLLLEIGPGEPANFSIEDLSGKAILSSSEIGEGSVTTVPWGDRVPPSVLAVVWDAESGPARAYWPVNVTDASKLPPPQELLDLPYEELLDVLASDLPLQEALSRARRKRPKPPGTPPSPGLPAELDPHRRVDTRTFLLRRVRRFSAALEGLRARLQRPAFTVEALRWRLNGPVGPLALARQVKEQEPVIGSFLLAEIALTLNGLAWKETDRYIDRKIREAESQAVLAEVRALADAGETDPSLAAYVRDALQEVSP